MKSENHSINLPIGELSNLTNKGNMGKLYIANSVRESLLSSTKSLVELSEEINVSENTIRRWANGTFLTIRRNNLNALAIALNKKIVFNNDTVELEDITIPTEIETDQNLQGDTMILNAEEIIKDLRDDKRDLRDTITNLKEENKALITTMQSMEKTIANFKEELESCTAQMPLLELDKYQNVVDIKAGVFINVSPLYAKKLGYTVFELVGASWEIVTPPEDRPMWQTDIERQLAEENKPCVVPTELQNHSVRLLHRDGHIVNAECQTKKISSVISMNECYFSD